MTKPLSMDIGERAMARREAGETVRAVSRFLLLRAFRLLPPALPCLPASRRCSWSRVAACLAALQRQKKVINSTSGRKAWFC